MSLPSCFPAAPFCASAAFTAWLDTLPPVALSRQAAMKAKKRAELAERRRIADTTKRPLRKLSGACVPKIDVRNVLVIA